MSFEKEFADERKRAILATQEAIKVTAIELFSGVITASPVGNPDLWESPPPPGYTGGSFRANWFLTQTTPSVKYDESLRTGKEEQNTDIASAVNIKASSSWFLTNNAPYSERLENGWSTQAPVGIAAPQISRVNALFDRIVRTANKKYGVE